MDTPEPSPAPEADPTPLPAAPVPPVVRRTVVPMPPLDLDDLAQLRAELDVLDEHDMISELSSVPQRRGSHRARSYDVETGGGLPEPARPDPADLARRLVEQIGVDGLGPDGRGAHSLGGRPPVPPFPAGRGLPPVPGPRALPAVPVVASDTRPPVRALPPVPPVPVRPAAEPVRREGPLPTLAPRPDPVTPITAPRPVPPPAPRSAGAVSRVGTLRPVPAPAAARTGAPPRVAGPASGLLSWLGDPS